MNIKTFLLKLRCKNRIENKIGIICLILIVNSSYSLAQDSLSTEREYSVYNYLINRAIASMDSAQIHKGYTISVKDSTVFDQFFFYFKDTDKIFTFKHFVDYYNLNKKKYRIDKTKLTKANTVDTKQKNKDFSRIRIEFNRCFLFDDEYAIVYFGVQYSPLYGLGCLYILQSTNGTWKILRKLPIWAS